MPIAASVVSSDSVSSRRPQRRHIAVLGAASLIILIVGASLSNYQSWSDWRLIVLLAFGAAIMGLSPTALAGGGRMTGSFFPLFLLMALAGPVPAAICAIVIESIASIIKPSSHRPAWVFAVGNVQIFVLYCLFGGALCLIATPLFGDTTSCGNGDAWGCVGSTTGLFFVYLITNMVNFILVRTFLRLLLGDNKQVPPFSSMFSMGVPVIMVGIAAVLSIAMYRSSDWMAIALALVIATMYQYTLGKLYIAQRRTVQLKAESEKLTVLQKGTLETMSEALALHDPLLARHCVRVSDLAYRLARRADLDDPACETVRVAGLFHDIGMFGMPEDSDDFSSDAEPSEMIRLHPLKGGQLLRHIPGMDDVAHLVETHHEAPAGIGYPRGLTADQIPFRAQLIAVAGAFDTLTAPDYATAPISDADALGVLHAHPDRFLPQAVDILHAEISERRSVLFDAGRSNTAYTLPIEAMDMTAEDHAATPLLQRSAG